MRQFLLGTGLFLFYGLCFFTSCQSGYKIHTINVSVVKMDSTWDSSLDRHTVSLIDLYKAMLDSTMNSVIGKSAIPMPVERPESLLPNLVVDVMRDAATSVLGKSVDIGLLTMGGIRTILSEGDITVGNVYEILPFENSLCVLTLKGSVVKLLMENIATTGGEAVSNVRLTISGTNQIRSALVGGKPIEDDRLYTLATINYLAEGNDRMTALTQCESRRCFDEITIRDLFMDYVKKQTVAGRSLTSRIEGRVIFEK